MNGVCCKELIWLHLPWRGARGGGGGAVRVATSVRKALLGTTQLRFGGNKYGGMISITLALVNLFTIFFFSNWVHIPRSNALGYSEWVGKYSVSSWTINITAFEGERFLKIKIHSYCAGGCAVCIKYSNQFIVWKEMSCLERPFPLFHLVPVGAQRSLLCS